MGKSKYPSKLDTSVEIPTVRNNILEIGPEVINSVKSALFQIERTLGINPQGASGNSVADRLNKALDGNGNIKKDALKQANVLSGPITNVDVSKVAAIKESKLRLDFPTNVLQSEISVLGNQLSNLIEQIEEVNSLLAVHIHPDAKNRHKASAISVENGNISASSTATSSVDGSSVQAVIEDIYNQHILYDGSDMSSTNNSHAASQVYFDDSDVSALVSADDVQEAIEGAINAADNAVVVHQDIQHSNGVLKIGKLDTPSDVNLGPIIVEDVSISFGLNAGTNDPTFLVTFDDAIEEEGFSVEVSDSLIITDSSDANSSLNGTFQIVSVTKDSGGNVASIRVFGIVSSSSTSNITGTVRKKLRRETSEGNLVLTQRESPDLTSSQIVQLSNPNAVKIISKNIKPSKITSSNKNLQFKIDETTHSVDVYDSSINRQTVSSIVRKINEAVAKNAWPFLAYNIRQEAGHEELALAHNIPDQDGGLHTIEIIAGSDSGLSALGFSHIEGKVISADYGTEYFIQGNGYEGLSEKLNTAELVYFAGTNQVQSPGELDFKKLNIIPGDVIHISESDDDGAYVVDSVSSSFLSLDSSQLPSGFSAANGDDTKFVIYHNVVNLSNLTFKKVASAFGSGLTEIFMDSSRQLFGHMLIEYASVLNGTNALFEIVDVEGNVAEETEFVLNISNATNGISVDLDSGAAINVLGKDNYIKLISDDIIFTILIDDADEVNTYISANSAIQNTFYLFPGVDLKKNLVLGRVPYAFYAGRVVGGPEGTAKINGAPEKGIVSYSDLSNSAIRQLTEVPIRDLRSDGVVRGFEISNISLSGGLYQFDIANGVCYIEGKRFALFDGTYLTDINSGVSDKIYIYINADGNVAFESALSAPSCASPLSDIPHALLYTLEFDGSVIYDIDLRLFINDIDLKIINDITVSPQAGLGHFSDFGKALKYARRFSDLFPNAGTPVVRLKAGEYDIATAIDNSDIASTGWSTAWTNNTNSVRNKYYNALHDNGLLIDFPVRICGEGDSTVLKLRNTYTFSDTTAEARGSFVFIGSAFSRTNRPISAPTSGFSSVNDLKLDNCRIEVADYNIFDGSNNAQYYGVDFNAVTIEHGTGFFNLVDFTLGDIGIILTEESDTSSKKGNFRIHNCRFIKSQIDSGKINSPDSTNFYNIDIIGCSLYGNTSGSTASLLGSTLFTGDEEKNITILGNQHYSNHNTLQSGSGPIMYDAIATDIDWGDRLSRDLTVKRNLAVGGSITGNSFVYDTTKTLYQVYLFDSNSVANIGPAGANASTADFLAQNETGGDWMTMRLPPTETGYLRINPPLGINIKDIKIGTKTSTNTWDYHLYGVPLNGAGHLLLNTGTGVNTTETGIPHSSTFSGVNIAANSSNVYYLGIENTTSGYDFVYYVQITYEFTDITDALGV